MINIPKIRHNNQYTNRTHCKNGHLFETSNLYASAKLNRRICKKCRILYRINNIEKIRASARKHYNKRKDEISLLRKLTRPSTSLKLKLDVLTYYGNGKLICLCCGESIQEFLTIDHIKNDGAEDRKKVHRTGHNIYRYLKRMNFPQGFQTLCFNCNSGKHINHGICPHKLTKNDKIAIEWQVVN